MRRSFTALAFIVLATLLGANLVATAATPNDTTCRKLVSTSVTNKDLLAYNGCRFDKLDAAVAAIKPTAAQPTPTSSPSSTAKPSASPTAKPSPSATPTKVSPTAAGTPSSSPTSSSPSAPSAGVASWTQVISEDFAAAATSAQVLATYAGSMVAYTDTTQYKRANISVHDGLLDLNLPGTSGAAVVFGPPSSVWGRTYGRFTIRFKAVDGLNNGTAMMLWPSSDKWGDGEIDYPEGNFDDQIHLYHHGLDCSDCSGSDSLSTGASFASWHTATTEWRPGAVHYYLDGVLLKTITHDVPTTDHRMTVQVAPSGSGAKPGHLLIDAYSIAALNE